MRGYILLILLVLLCLSELGWSKRGGRRPNRRSREENSRESNSGERSRERSSSERSREGNSGERSGERNSGERSRGRNSGERSCSGSGEGSCGSGERGRWRNLNSEKKLIQRLLRTYESIGKYGRPVKEVKDTVNVSFGLTLIQIEDFDTDKSILTSNAWLKYQWMDDFLKWDPAKYDGIQAIRLPTRAIWKPDIELYNTVSFGNEKRKTLALVSSHGSVIWIPALTLRTTCAESGRGDDTDENSTTTCSYKFGSWTFNGNEVDVNFYGGLKEIDTTALFASKKWDVVSTSAQKNNVKYPCCNETYPNLEFKVELRRK